MALRLEIDDISSRFFLSLNYLPLHEAFARYLLNFRAVVSRLWTVSQARKLPFLYSGWRSVPSIVHSHFPDHQTATGEGR